MKNLAPSPADYAVRSLTLSLSLSWLCCSQPTRRSSVASSPENLPKRLRSFTPLRSETPLSSLLTSRYEPILSLYFLLPNRLLSPAFPSTRLPICSSPFSVRAGPMTFAPSTR